MWSTARRLEERSDKVRREKQEARIGKAGFLLRLFPRERRYADLGCLLPVSIGPAVKTRCIGPSSWHISYIYPSTARTFGYAPVGHGARPQPICMSSRDYTGLTFSAHGPFRLRPSVKDTFWPSRSSSKLTP